MRGNQSDSPMRLGFAVKVLGQDLKSSDMRRWQKEPHLRVSLEYVHGVLDYLRKKDIRMYRLSSDLAPYATHPEFTQFHGQVAECADELAVLGKRAKEEGVRLSFHPSQFIVLNAPDPALVQKSIWDLTSQAEMLDRMELGPEAVLVIHVGGLYGQREAAIQRWVDTYRLLPAAVKRRLVLENDDIRFSAADVLRIHEQTGVPLIFDLQHYYCNNPEALPLEPTLRRFLATWPGNARPKIHFSSPRTELRTVSRKNRQTGKKENVLLPPVWTGHADYGHPFEFFMLLRLVPDQVFDIMVEAKAKDLAVLRLRQDLRRYAPDLAPRFGLEPDVSAEPAAEEIALPTAVFSEE